MGEKRSAPVGIGVTTVMMVLLVLTLSVFAALTLSSARADLARSYTNAETVSAWYEADARACALYRDFAAGSAQELEEYLPFTQRQDLYLHLVREGGEVKILAWQAVNSAFCLEEDPLPIWDGEFSG